MNKKIILTGVVLSLLICGVSVSAEDISFGDIGSAIKQNANQITAQFIPSIKYYKNLGTCTKFKTKDDDGEYEIFGLEKGNCHAIRPGYDCNLPKDVYKPFAVSNLKMIKGMIEDVQKGGLPFPGGSELDYVTEITNKYCTMKPIMKFGD